MGGAVGRHDPNSPHKGGGSRHVSTCWVIRLSPVEVIVVVVVVVVVVNVVVANVVGVVVVVFLFVVFLFVVCCCCFQGERCPNPIYNNSRSTAAAAAMLM